MNNLCKLLLSALMLQCLFSCTDRGTQPYDVMYYIYRNTLADSVTVDFYRRSPQDEKKAIKRTFHIKDSVIIAAWDGNTTFGYLGLDSCTFRFYDGKKITFRKDRESPHWDLNPSNLLSHRLINKYDGYATLFYFTYIIDENLKELAD